jgi:hypothetical protein
MALIPKNSYPGQTISGDAGYPQGKARNQLVPDDGTGTPLEELWVNDLFGMQQALLNDAAITPSGVPDTVSTSQYLTALKTLFIYGKAGGTWNPSAAITIGGAGLTVSGPLVLSGSGSADFNGFVTFDSAVTFNSSITIDGFPTFSQGFIVTSGDSEFNDDVLFTAPIVAQSTAQVDGVLTANAGIVVANGAIIGGGAFMSGVILLTNDGHIRKRIGVATNGNHTFGVDEFDKFLFAVDSLLSAPRQWTINDDGAGQGDEIVVSRRKETSVHDITVVRSSDATTLITLSTAGVRHAVLTFVSAAGGWMVSEQQ